jgi:hypothetical protein
MNLREFTAGTQAMVDGVRQHLFGVARLAGTLHRPKDHGRTAMFFDNHWSTRLHRRPHILAAQA